jgi:hypothetical protein
VGHPIGNWVVRRVGKSATSIHRASGAGRITGGREEEWGGRSPGRADLAMLPSLETPAGAEPGLQPKLLRLRGNQEVRSWMC